MTKYFTGFDNVKTKPVTWEALNRLFDEVVAKEEKDRLSGEVPRDPLGRDRIWLSPAKARAFRKALGMPPAKG